MAKINFEVIYETRINFTCLFPWQFLLLWNLLYRVPMRKCFKGPNKFEHSMTNFRVKAGKHCNREQHCFYTAVLAVIHWTNNARIFSLRFGVRGHEIWLCSEIWVSLTRKYKKRMNAAGMIKIQFRIHEKQRKMTLERNPEISEFFF